MSHLHLSGRWHPQMLDETYLRLLSRR
jgi:hypothetical protein